MSPLVAAALLFLSANVVSAQDTSFGQRLFQDKADCQFCHGIDGDGRGDPRSPGQAADLVRLKVDIIVTWYSSATAAAKLETRDIPIVCAICGDMVATGMVESLARPGGNITGIGGVGAELSAKCVELMCEVVPAARHIVAALGFNLDQTLTSRWPTHEGFADILIYVLQRREWG